MKSVLILFTALLFSSCIFNGEDYAPPAGSKAKYMSYEVLRSSVSFEAPREIEKRGKIYLYDTKLLINEPNKGVHIFDNSNAASPVALGFLNVPGNVDIAVKDGILLLDSFVDLIAVDLSVPGKATVTKRLKDIFTYDPYQIIEEDIYLNYDQTQGVVIGYE